MQLQTFILALAAFAIGQTNAACGCKPKSSTTTVVAADATATTAAAAATSDTSAASSTSDSSNGNISPNGLCGPDQDRARTGYTCLGSQFGDCCSQYGFCGSTDAYCGSGCLGGYGRCI
ncbi:hypothetical protein KC316_g1597 [Hortaea werneckii]|nr:hypothetical protein KC355_g5730 [Hortaea werneckii]KAI7202460.1 hypothetical protein KC324_g1722 [Hortaea werneckii]KAI7593651.1 hypothetical protein KC316_g1597 [Hortaea werneckii]